jgi:hypothetical protein
LPKSETGIANKQKNLLVEAWYRREKFCGKGGIPDPDSLNPVPDSDDTKVNHALRLYDL